MILSNAGQTGGLESAVWNGLMYRNTRIKIRKIENDYVAITAKGVGNHLSPRRWQGTNGYQNNPGAIGVHWKPNALWAALVDPFAKAKFLPGDS